MRVDTKEDVLDITIEKRYRTSNVEYAENEEQMEIVPFLHKAMSFTLGHPLGCCRMSGLDLCISHWDRSRSHWRYVRVLITVLLKSHTTLASDN